MGFVILFYNSDSVTISGDLGLGSRVVDTRVRIPGPGGNNI